MPQLTRTLAVAIGAGVLLGTGATGLTSATHAAMPYDSVGADCLRTEQTVAHPPASSPAAARGGHGGDHRPVTAAEQREIRAETRSRLAREGLRAGELSRIDATVPVYVHVMTASNGDGDVTRSQIEQQIQVMNDGFSGAGSPDAADLGVTFELAGVDRYRNDAWHQDRQSKRYRRLTRQGGADALNIWLVDFSYLGVATFPWDYDRKGAIDGVRVHWDSLPGGAIQNYNLGETATHEVGHWLGLYHTFQGGCTETNDEVADTPAQSGPTAGCPEGRDSCDLPGLDPIHNYMDYSFDSCFTEFTPGQAERAAQAWAAYRG